MAERLKFLLDALLSSYAQIFLSRARSTGGWVLLATLIFPEHGLSGLVGVLAANLVAIVLGIDRQSIRLGLYGFNGALLGLGLGAAHVLQWHLVLLIVILAVPLTALTAGLDYLFRSHLGLPALSLPFLLMIGVSITLTTGLETFPIVQGRWGLHDLSWLGSWPALRQFLENLGAILFQKSAVSGGVVLLALLFESRLAFFLLLMGYFTASGMLQVFGIDGYFLKVLRLGFNPMLTALAIGGHFAVPGVASLLFAAFSAAWATLLMVAVPSLAFPFVATVIPFALLLRLRSPASRYLRAVTHSGATPEVNFLNAYSDAETEKRASTWISLPFFGSWKVSQGVDGTFTHQGVWRFAFDFQAVDSQLKLYRGTGAQLQDYYSFGSPVIASGPGVVRALVNEVPDNPVGIANLQQNWGNYVIIEHPDGRFSCVAHLKQGSIRVAVGQSVRRGEVLGQGGNSGRSLFPHLHFQLQAYPWVGAPTVEFEFENLTTLSGQVRRRGLIYEEEVVRNLVLRSSDLPNLVDPEMRVEDGILFDRREMTRGPLRYGVPFLEESSTMEWTQQESPGAQGWIDRAMSFMGISSLRRLQYRVCRDEQGLSVRVSSSIFLESPLGGFSLPRVQERRIRVHRPVTY